MSETKDRELYVFLFPVPFYCRIVEILNAGKFFGGLSKFPEASFALFHEFCTIVTSPLPALVLLRQTFAGRAALVLCKSSTNLDLSFIIPINRNNRID